MKKWIRSLGLSGFAAAALGLAWSGAAVAQGADKFQDILSKGVVRIGVPVDAPPFGSVNQQRQPEGFDIELAEMVAKALGAKLEMTQVTGANRIPYLLSDRVDIIISRRFVVDFSSGAVVALARCRGDALGPDRARCFHLRRPPAAPLSASVGAMP
jgi:ABC-type amino acid transport substrate-binding protein